MRQMMQAMGQKNLPKLQLHSKSTLIVRNLFEIIRRKTR